MPDEFGYVIERYYSSELRYWNGHKLDSAGFSTEHRDAVRFAREVDASHVLGWLLEGNGRVVQHGWTDCAKEKTDVG